MIENKSGLQDEVFGQMTDNQKASLNLAHEGSQKVHKYIDSAPKKMGIPQISLKTVNDILMDHGFRNPLS